MKRMRIIGLVGVLLALFVLAGCDAILESFYPEFSDDARSGNFGIGVWVEIVIPPEAGIPNNPMIGAMVVDAWSGDPNDFNNIELGKTMKTPNWNFDNDTGNTIFSAYVELYVDTEGGDYRVIVWGEEGNGNQQPDWDEPQTDATWYNPYIDDDDPIFSYWPDSDEYSATWVDGGAFINVSGDGTSIPVYLFNVSGSLVFDEDTAPAAADKTFNLTLADPERRILDYSWNLYSESYEHFGGDYVALPTPASDVPFVIPSGVIPKNPLDPNQYLKGWYWLETAVTFADFTYESARFPIRIINEAGSGSLYNVQLNIFDSSWDPLYLADGQQVGILAQILDKNGNEIQREVFSTSPLGGVLSPWIANTISYNQTAFNDGGNDGIDAIRVTIDVNNNGRIDGGDFRRKLPLSLDAGDWDGSAYVLDYDISGWDFRPVFEDEGPL